MSTRQSHTLPKFALMVAVAALAACDSQEREQPQPNEDVAPAAVERQSTLLPPRMDEFATAWAEACPDAEPVGKALCKSKGFGEPNFTCDYALGDDAYRRHTAELMPGEGRWELVDPERACRAG